MQIAPNHKLVVLLKFFQCGVDLVRHACNGIRNRHRFGVAVIDVMTNVAILARAQRIVANAVGGSVFSHLGITD